MNFLETLLGFLEKFWPLAKVEQWECGLMYVFGRTWKRGLTPGIYPFMPWFMDVRTASIVPTPISSPLLNITLSDGKTLSYSVTAVVCVRNTDLAINAVDNYQQSAAELLSAITSEKLAEVDASRVAPTGRKRLLADLTRWINEQTRPFGLEVVALRFTNFALNQRAYRLLMDTAIGSPTL